MTMYTSDSYNKHTQYTQYIAFTFILDKLNTTVKIIQNKIYLTFTFIQNKITTKLSKITSTQKFTKCLQYNIQYIIGTSPAFL